MVVLTGLGLACGLGHLAALTRHRRVIHSRSAVQKTLRVFLTTCSICSQSALRARLRANRRATPRLFNFDFCATCSICSQSALRARLRAYRRATPRLFNFILVLTGLGLASARSPRGSNTPPACYSLPLGRSKNAPRFSHYLQHLLPKRLAGKVSRIQTRHTSLYFANGYIIANFCSKVKPFGEFFAIWGEAFRFSPFCIIPRLLPLQFRRHR